MGFAGSLTGRLRQYSDGDSNVADAVMTEIWPRLRGIAARKLSRERFCADLTPSDLIQETWVRNLRKGGWSINDREHFYCIAGMAMQRVLIGLARARATGKRRATMLSLDDLPPQAQTNSATAEQVIDICVLMDRLRKKDPAVAAVVYMHYIMDKSLEEIAENSGLTLRQVRYRWDKGKTWLAGKLGYSAR